MCILSMGSDPTDLITGLAKKKKKEVLSVSMGQGQEVVARRFCDQGVATGCWALLQNCHLGIKFLVELEQRLATKDLEEIDPDFRVWITSEPHPSFPIGLLQMSIKITNEAPVGMKAGMKRSYAWITQAREGGVERGAGAGWARCRRSGSGCRLVDGAWCKDGGWAAGLSLNDVKESPPSTPQPHAVRMVWNGRVWHERRKE